MNKIQIKAEILMVLSKIQSMKEPEDKILDSLIIEDDKQTILDILIKELIKSDEKRAVYVCFLLIKLCDKTMLENELWNVIKDTNVSDFAKMTVLNLLRDLGNQVKYDDLSQYFNSIADVIDSDTKELLHVAIMNPEAQIDFLDFLTSVADCDKILLLHSLSDDYAEDALANIVNPVLLKDPTTEIAKVAIDILGKTKSQLALHALTEIKPYTPEDIQGHINKNIALLKISGIREDNSIAFYSDILSGSKPYKCFTSLPDGHGNQAIIFSRKRTNETIQFMATVINDKYGILDCFGFNEIGDFEFDRIVERFYSEEPPIAISACEAKHMLESAEIISRNISGKVPYEFVCWKTLLLDIEEECIYPEIQKVEISQTNFNKICMADFIQKWFLDVDESEVFNQFIAHLNSKYLDNDFKLEPEYFVNEWFDKIFTDSEKALWKNRIKTTANLLFKNNNIEIAEILNSLENEVLDEFFKNILRKSIYEYYISAKFKLNEAKATKNIFRKNEENKEPDFKLMQLDMIITTIEDAWVNA